MSIPGLFHTLDPYEKDFKRPSKDPTIPNWIPRKALIRTLRAIKWIPRKARA